MAKQSKSSGKEDLLQTLGDFTSKENWDKFFSIRGSDDSFEWYADWPNLQNPLLSQLSNFKEEKSIQILIPGCGNSKLSENLYDAGFHGITNIDFSKVVISDMLRRNVRTRPDMRWRVMDMTHMQFTDDTFDAVVDKGGLDALMEPELGPSLGTQYISEVKRVLKPGGKFACLTLAESHVLGLLFSKFRFGWNMSVHAIPHEPSNKPSFRTFMVVVEKERSTMLHQITSSFDHSSLDCDINQRRGLVEALETENRTRSECSSGADILYSLEDLQLGAGGDLKQLIPGRRLQLFLGEEKQSKFSYKAVLLDAQQQAEEFNFHCGVLLVPENRTHEWIFTSEEGQWTVVESSKAARLIMVLLDSRHSHVGIDDIQKDLSPLVKNLAPGKHEDGPQIPFMMANDGIKQRNVVHQVTSAMSGPIIVEDVIYEKSDASPSGHTSKDMGFRRLIFQRSLGLVQSEAFLCGEGFIQNNSGEMDRKKPNSISKSKKKVSQRRNSSSVPLGDESKKQLMVNHQSLASAYHMGIIDGFALIASTLQNMESSNRMAKTVIIGLGGGLLPMFLRLRMPCLSIEVVELDPVVVRLARDYFGFVEDKQLRVHVADGIEFVKEVANNTTSCSATIKHETKDSVPNEKLSSSNGNSNYIVGDKETTKIDVLIIDVDSADSSSGMSCPHPDFVNESFLVSVKESLSEGGLFAINLVSRSTAIRKMVISRLKAVFHHLYSFQLEEDVNEVLFALPTDLCANDTDAGPKLRNLLKTAQAENCQPIAEIRKEMICLK
ncbi:Methyltransferase-like protein [Thalictrum thalictroides]|uniref:Methyltransferase-like protein n=1 Tax=Thalictrum thalictroides TaxID=46969 RepID=A0A7J6W4Z2_THATH|nr:Methyltransferase-like protein [Thalictrum thalictroides]